MTDKLPIEERKTPYTPDVISRLTQNWFAGQPDAQILLTTDERATSDNAPSYTGIGFGLHDFMAMLRERDSLAAQLATIRAETVEECVQKAIQTLFEEGFSPGLQKVVGRALRSLQHAEPQE